MNKLGEDTYYTFSTPSRDMLDTFANPVECTTCRYDVQFQSDEVSALCPVTSQPDWYTVAVRYSPAERCMESKSAKLYLHAFRNYGTFIETFANRIADDWFEVLQPHWLHVRLQMKPRGGIGIVVEVTRGLGGAHNGGAHDGGARNG